MHSWSKRKGSFSVVVYRLACWLSAAFAQSGPLDLPSEKKFSFLFCLWRGFRTHFSIVKLFSNSLFSVRTWGSLEQKQQYQSGQNKIQTANCRLGAKCRQGTKCRTQTGYKMHTENLYCFFRLISDNMSSYNLPSVTQSLFHDHLSRLFALLWNIPCPFLDHSRS